MNATTACSFPAPWRKSPPPPPDPADPETESDSRETSSADRKTYTGYYTHQAFGNIEITDTGTALVLSYGNNTRLALEPRNETHFKGTFVGNLWFLSSADGGVGTVDVHFIMDEESSDEDNARRPKGISFPLNFKSGFMVFEKLEYNIRAHPSAENSATCLSGYWHVCVLFALLMF